MRSKVFITGRGLVTPLGSGLDVNKEALLNKASGISKQEDWKNYGMESLVGGKIDPTKVECPLLNLKNKRFLTPCSIYAIAATYEAMLEAGYTLEKFQKLNIAVVMGHGGSAHEALYKGAKTGETTQKLRRISPFTVPLTMPSANAGNISLIFGLKGENFSVTSACASGAHAIATAARLIRSGEYDIVVTGGSEELSWIHVLGFDAMKAVSRKYNDTPEKGTRPFDADRDGFVIAEGAGIVILESEEHIKKRGGKAIAEVTGIGANSNATDMVVPNAEASALVMEKALNDAGLKAADIEYINTHGTSTPVGDPVELDAIKEVFFDSNKDVIINSTKSQTGHMIGATAAIELIYSTQMIEDSFVSATVNYDTPMEGYEWANISPNVMNNVEVNHALSNSLGFGGTNCCLIVSKVK